MAIPSFDSPREGSSTIFELLPLDGHLSFSKFLKAYLLPYFEFGYITSTSKATMNETSMVVTTVWGLMKCKFEAAF